MEIPDPEPLTNWANRQHQNRLDAMYVDFVATGEIKAPKYFPSGEAKEAVEVAAFAARILVPALVEALSEIDLEPPHWAN